MPSVTAIPETVLSISGGGAKGQALPGAIQAIEDQGIKITHAMGSSVGAITAALYATGSTPAELQNIAKETDFKGLIYSGTRHYLYNHPAEKLQTLIDDQIRKNIAKKIKESTIISQDTAITDCIDTSTGKGYVKYLLYLAIAALKDESRTPVNSTTHLLQPPDCFNETDFTETLKKIIKKQPLCFKDLKALRDDPDYGLPLKKLTVSATECGATAAKTHYLNEDTAPDAYITDAVMASASLPGMIKSRRIAGYNKGALDYETMFTDGGLMNNIVSTSDIALTQSEIKYLLGKISGLGASAKDHLSTLIHWAYRKLINDFPGKRKQINDACRRYLSHADMKKINECRLIDPSIDQRRYRLRSFMDAIQNELNQPQQTETPRQFILVFDEGLSSPAYKAIHEKEGRCYNPGLLSKALRDTITPRIAGTRAKNTKHKEAGFQKIRRQHNPSRGTTVLLVPTHLSTTDFKDAKKHPEFHYDVAYYNVKAQLDSYTQTNQPALEQSAATLSQPATADRPANPADQLVATSPADTEQDKKDALRIFLFTAIDRAMKTPSRVLARNHKSLKYRKLASIAASQDKTASNILDEFITACRKMRNRPGFFSDRETVIFKQLMIELNRALSAANEGDNGQDLSNIRDLIRGSNSLRFVSQENGRSKIKYSPQPQATAAGSLTAKRAAAPAA